MPTYEYKCGACSHAFERFQKISDSPVQTCPECGMKKVERLISAGGGLVFKGPGFYATDYRKESPKAPGSSPGETSSKEGSESASTEGSTSGEGKKDKTEEGSDG